MLRWIVFCFVWSLAVRNGALVGRWVWLSMCGFVLGVLLDGLWFEAFKAATMLSVIGGLKVMAWWRSIALF